MSVKKGLLGGLITTALFLGAGVLLNQPLSESEVLEKARGAVVKVELLYARGGGTGFFINKFVKNDQGLTELKTLLITNKHVCEAVEGQPFGLTIDGKVIEAIKYAKSIDHDLCALEPFLSEPVKTLKIADKPTKIDGIVYTVGHPALRPLTISKGRYIGDSIIQLPKFNYKRCSGIEETLPPLYQILTGREKVCLMLFHSLQTTNIIFGGNSGSPLLNERGEVTGVVFAGNRQQVTDSYSVPLIYLKKFIKIL